MGVGSNPQKGGLFPTFLLISITFAMKLNEFASRGGFKRTPEPPVNPPLVLEDVLPY